MFTEIRVAVYSNLVVLYHTKKNVIIVGSLASEFLGWSWKTHVGIPTLDIGIPTLEFQVQHRNSNVGFPTPT